MWRWCKELCHHCVSFEKITETTASHTPSILPDSALTHSKVVWWGATWYAQNNGRFAARSFAGPNVMCQTLVTCWIDSCFFQRRIAWELWCPHRPTNYCEMCVTTLLSFHYHLCIPMFQPLHYHNNFLQNLLWQNANLSKIGVNRGRWGGGGDGHPVISCCSVSFCAASSCIMSCLAVSCAVCMCVCMRMCVHVCVCVCGGGGGLG